MHVWLSTGVSGAHLFRYVLCLKVQHEKAQSEAELQAEIDRLNAELERLRSSNSALSLSISSCTGHPVSR